MKARQPQVLSHLNLRSLFTSKEIASNTEAAYPTIKTIVSFIMIFKCVVNAAVIQQLSSFFDEVKQPVKIINKTCLYQLRARIH